MIADDILFASVNLPCLDKTKATHEMLSLKKHSFWNTYRQTTMIPLMTKHGLSGKAGTQNRRTGDFSWVDYTPTIVKDWFETIVFPWIGMKSRVMALITEPGAANAEHIDCDPIHIKTRQHKLRVVLQGNTNTLYFCTQQGNISVPNVAGLFLMDGGWPHGMINDHELPKVTLALGSPWDGKENYTNNELDIMMLKSDYTLPQELKVYYKKERDPY